MKPNHLSLTIFLSILFLANTSGCSSSSNQNYNSQTQNCIYDSMIEKENCLMDAKLIKSECSDLIGDVYINCNDRYCSKIRFCFKSYNINVNRCGGKPTFNDKANALAPCF